MSDEKVSQGNELKDILSGLYEWRKQNPQATMAEIERETMRRMARLQARLVEELSQTLPEAERQVRPVCPECGNKMQNRGQEERQLQGPGDQEIQLKRAYWVCPVCGTGIFPPG